MRNPQRQAQTLFRKHADLDRAANDALSTNIGNCLRVAVSAIVAFIEARLEPTRGTLSVPEYGRTSQVSGNPTCRPQSIKMANSAGPRDALTNHNSAIQFGVAAPPIPPCSPRSEPDFHHARHKPIP